MDSFMTQEGAGMEALLSWPTNYPKAAAMAVYGLALVLVLVLVYFLVFAGNGKEEAPKEGYGQTTNWNLLDQDNVLVGGVSERFVVDAFLAKDLPPSSEFKPDGVDKGNTQGSPDMPYRVGAVSGLKYYYVRGPNGDFVKNSDGFFVHAGTSRVGSMDVTSQDSTLKLLRTNWGEKNAVTGFAAQCKVEDADQGDTWGWVNAAVRQSTADPYKESMKSNPDAVLSKVMQGL